MKGRGKRRQRRREDFVFLEKREIRGNKKMKGVIFFFFLVRVSEREGKPWAIKRGVDEIFSFSSFN